MFHFCAQFTTLGLQSGNLPFKLINLRKTENNHQHDSGKKNNCSQNAFRDRRTFYPNFIRTSASNHLKQPTFCTLCLFCRRMRSALHNSCLCTDRSRACICRRISAGGKRRNSRKCTGALLRFISRTLRGRRSRLGRYCLLRSSLRLYSCSFPSRNKFCRFFKGIDSLGNFSIYPRNFLCLALCRHCGRTSTAKFLLQSAAQWIFYRACYMHLCACHCLSLSFLYIPPCQAVLLSISFPQSAALRFLLLNFLQFLHLKAKSVFL